MRIVAYSVITTMLLSTGCNSKTSQTPIKPLPVTPELKKPVAPDGIPDKTDLLKQIEMKLVEILEVRAHNTALILKDLNTVRLLLTEAEKSTAKKLANNIDEKIKLLWADGNELPNTFTQRDIAMKIEQSTGNENKIQAFRKLISDTNEAVDFLEGVFDNNQAYTFVEKTPQDRKLFGQFKFQELVVRDVSLFRHNLLKQDAGSYKHIWFRDRKEVSDIETAITRYENSGLRLRVLQAIQKEADRKKLQV